MANDIPTPRSLPQIEGEILATVTSRVGLRKLKLGSGVLSAIEGAAQSDVRNSQDIFQMMQSRDLDNSTGIALDRIGADEKVPRFSVKKTTGTVTLTDTSFDKISSRVYQGLPAIIIGSEIVFVEDASLFPATGAIYIGRTTPQLEGPISYTAKTDNGAYWTLDLATPTTKFHNRGESVIVAQGGIRTIDAGYLIATPDGALASAVQFSTTFPVEIPDGEVDVTDVDVTATVPGAASNVAAGAITEFPTGVPFPGATTTNPLPFITGRDTELDDPYRERIRAVRNSRQRGTDLAIETAVLGIVSPDENRRVTSATMVRRKNEPSVLYIDDGSGYEEQVQGVGIEVVADSTSGGERDFKTLHQPVAKAHLKSANQAPFLLVDAMELAVKVGGVVYRHFFDTSEFNSISNASGYEVVASINADPTIAFSARTWGGGKYVIIFSRFEENEDLEIVEVVAPSTDANDSFQFPTSRRFTALLYKNDRLLNKDGDLAFLRSEDFTTWNAFAGSQTLEIGIDGTPVATYTFVDQDFIDGVTGFNGVGKNSITAWQTVINAKIPGVTASIEGDNLVLTSNKGRDVSARVRIVGGTLVGQNMFVTGDESGANFDYNLDRATGEIVLEASAGIDDRYTLGSAWTRAFLETGVLTPSTVPSNVNLWFVVDGGTEMVPHGLGAATAIQGDLLAILPHGYRVRLRADQATAAFANVAAGDWMTLWDPDTSIPDALRNSFRVIETELDGSDLANRLVLEHGGAAVPRIGHGTVSLTPPGGELPAKILTCGGATLDLTSTLVPSPTRRGRGITDSVEIFDPVTNIWSEAAHMITPRTNHTTTLLSNGKVLVTGGFGPDGVALATTEIYDPSLNSWALGPNFPGNTERAYHVATTLASGRVLVYGGWDGDVFVYFSSYEYDPGSNAWMNAASMTFSHFGHRGVKLSASSAQPDKVFTVGGFDAPGSKIVVAELYDPATFTWALASGLEVGRAFFGLANTDDPNKVVAIGDCDLSVGSGNQATFEIYDVSTNNWTFAPVPISQVGTVDIFYADKPAVTSDQNEYALAFCAHRVDNDTLVEDMVHLRFQTGTDTWDVISSDIWARAVERRSITLTPIVGSSVDQIFIHAGAQTYDSGFDSSTATTCATHQTYDPGSDNVWPFWSTLALVDAQTTSRGVVFYRTDEAPRKITETAGAGYTAATYVTQLADLLPAATPAVFRTSRLRISTNTFGLDGDLTLVTTDVEDLPPLEVGVVEHNLTGHLASVVAGNSGFGTPAEFAVHNVLYFETGQTPDAAISLCIAENTLSTPTDDPKDPPQVPPTSNTQLVGLKRWTDGLNPRFWEQSFVVPTDDKRCDEFGQGRGFRAAISDLETEAGTSDQKANRTKIGLRTYSGVELNAHQPVVFAMPHSMGAEDDITVVIDNDIDTKRFAIPMFRRCKPADSGFDDQIALTDVDGGNVTLASSFGAGYNFNDFAVYMQARVKSHGLTAGKRILWRYFRHGAEGNYATLRYMYADESDQNAVITRVVQTQNDSPIYDLEGVRKISVDVLLDSGAERTGSQFQSTTKIGLARVNPTGDVYDAYALLGFAVIEGERGASGDPTRLRVQVPNNGVVAQGPQDSGITAGDVLWFEAAVPGATTLLTGAFIVASVDPFNAGTGQQDIYVPANVLHDGTSAWTLTANPGTLSFDGSAEAFWDTSTVDGDMFRSSLDNPYIPTEYSETTLRIAAHGRQYLRMRMPWIAADAVTTPAWYSIVDTTLLSIFAGPTKTATQIASDINDLQGATSICPVTATVTGTGADIIALATWDEENDTSAHFEFTDGINFVQRTITPPDLVTDTEFLLKDPVSSDLATDADWANEDIRLVPILSSSIVAWLNTPAITGLWTAAEIKLAEGGTTVQIASLTPGTEGSVQVQGGGANSATAAVHGAPTFVGHGTGGIDSFYSTVRRTEGKNFVGGAWVRADNALALAKAPFWTDTSTLEIVNESILNQGQFILDVAPYTLIDERPALRVEIEKIGKFVAIHIPFLDNTVIPTFWSGGNFIAPGGYVYLCDTTISAVGSMPELSSANKGTFKIIRCHQGNLGVTLWIENDSAINERGVVKFKLLTADSMVPGDKWSNLTTRFGVRNRKVWTISTVGQDFFGSNPQEQFVALGTWFNVDTTESLPDPQTTITFGVDAAVAVAVYEGQPARSYHKIVAIAPNQDNGDFLDIQFDNSHDAAKVAAAGGTVLTAMDKLDFPLGIFLGTDGYAYNTGLIGEANKVIYGDPADEATYPGYAASGASILESGPLVKRVKIALAVRVQSGLANDDMADRIRSTVASVVNSTPVSTGRAISDIVTAAGEVGGVIAVSVVKPNYTSTSDLIPASAGQKLLVLDLKADVTVYFIGE